MGNLVLTVTRKLWKKKPKLNMLLGKYIYNLFHIAWKEKYYLPLGVVMALRVQISCKKNGFAFIFQRINCSEALIFAHAKTPIIFQFHRRDNFDVNSFCCILGAFSWERIRFLNFIEKVGLYI